MFTILDRYIIKKYLGTFVYVVCALVAVICAIDFAEKNDDFMDANLDYSYVFTEYYLNYIPYLANFLSPLLVFVSTIIVISRMAAHTEVIAILSTRISYLRMMFSFFLGSLFVSAFVFVMIGWILPAANKKRVAFEVEYVFNRFDYRMRDTHVKLEEDYFAYLKKYNNQINVGYEFTVEHIVDGVLHSKLKANRIAWDSTKGKWRIDPYELREYYDGKETLTRMPAKDTTINLFPSDFQSKYRLNETMTIPELKEYIAVQTERGADDVGIYVTDLYERYTYPFAIILLTMVAITVASKKSREGTGLKILLGFILAFVYLFFVMVGRGFVQSALLPPLLSAWIPNIIFGLVGCYLYTKAPK